MCYKLRRRAFSAGKVGASVRDAIHLATALSIGTDLGAVFSYDAGLSDAAIAAGLNVVAPS
ncbi:MAG: hypothetical protein M3Z00_04555 [Actinomycetota bacterium]|nr:hypothetical protein [Actinomycetota bacterium]